MSANIHFNSIIERPKDIVQTALSEGLTVFTKLGDISEVMHSQNDDTYHAKLSNQILCLGLNNVHLTITIFLSDDDLRERTHFKSILTYKYPVKHSLVRFILKAILRQYLIFEVKTRFHQFKHRIEKWL